MNQSPNLTARPEVITPAAPLIFEGVNDYGFAFRFEIRTARINGKRWAAAPDVMKAAGVRTRTASGKLLRRAIQAVCEGRDAGDLTTIEDPSALANLQQQWRA
mgnify:CR=1 FL=1